MQKFRVQMKEPIFDSIHVDQDFLDNPPKVPLIWKSGDQVFVEETLVELGDWIIFVDDENGELYPEVITDNCFHRFYEVIDES